MKIPVAIRNDVRVEDHDVTVIASFPATSRAKEFHNIRYYRGEAIWRSNGNDAALNAFRLPEKSGPVPNK